MSQTRPERNVRSTSRFAGVTRVGLRVVAVAGFAGAIWALSASAANAAADPTNVVGAANASGAPLTSSVISLVNGVGSGTLNGLLSSAPVTGSHGKQSADSALTPVSNVLTSTVKPALDTGTGVLSAVLAPTNTVLSHDGTGKTAHPGADRATTSSGTRHAAVAAPTSPAELGPVVNQATAGQSVRPYGADLNDETGVGSSDLVRTVSDVVAPLGLDQVLQPSLDVLQPMSGIIDPLTAPLDQLLSPVTGVVTEVTTPIFDALGAVIRPVVEVVTRSTDGMSSSSAAPLDTAAPLLTTPMPSVIPAGEVEQTMDPATPVRVDEGTSAQRAIVRNGTRGAPAHRSGREGPDRRNIPASPVPLPALPAPSLGGISTTASGSHEGNGGVAIVSVSVVRDVAASRHSAGMTGFAVRRPSVENPTVSPD